MASDSSRENAYSSLQTPSLYHIRISPFRCWARKGQLTISALHVITFNSYKLLNITQIFDGHLDFRTAPELSMDLYIQAHAFKCTALPPYPSAGCFNVVHSHWFTPPSGLRPSKVIMVTETIRLIRDREKGVGGRGCGGGGRRGLQLSLHCHHQNDSCIKMGSDESWDDPLIH